MVGPFAPATDQQYAQGWQCSRLFVPVFHHAGNYFVAGTVTTGCHHYAVAFVGFVGFVGELAGWP